MTSSVHRGETATTAARHAKYIQRGEIENGKTLWKIGRVRRRTERLPYWVLLVMPGLSFSICPNHFHDLTGRRFRFHIAVLSVPELPKGRSALLREKLYIFFFLFIHSHRTRNSASKYFFYFVSLPCNTEKKISFENIKRDRDIWRFS